MAKNINQIKNSKYYVTYLALANMTLGGIAWRNGIIGLKNTRYNYKYTCISQP